MSKSKWKPSKNSFSELPENTHLVNIQAHMGGGAKGNTNSNTSNGISNPHISKKRKQNKPTTPTALKRKDSDSPMRKTGFKKGNKMQNPFPLKPFCPDQIQAEFSNDKESTNQEFDQTIQKLHNLEVDVRKKPQYLFYSNEGNHQIKEFSSPPAFSKERLDRKYDKNERSITTSSSLNNSLNISQENDKFNKLIAHVHKTSNAEVGVLQRALVEKYQNQPPNCYDSPVSIKKMGEVEISAMEHIPIRPQLAYLSHINLIPYEENRPILNSESVPYIKNIPVQNYKDPHSKFISGTKARTTSKNTLNYGSPNHLIHNYHNSINHNYCGSAAEMRMNEKSKRFLNQQRHNTSSNFEQKERIGELKKENRRCERVIGYKIRAKTPNPTGCYKNKMSVSTNSNNYLGGNKSLLQAHPRVPQTPLLAKKFYAKKASNSESKSVFERKTGSEITNISKFLVDKVLAIRESQQQAKNPTIISKNVLNWPLYRYSRKSQTPLKKIH
jgi:hypothetical protein